jgi:uncharacterized phage protein (TIGR02218 family)
MSFNAFEISDRAGKPVFLFRFTLGVVTYNYTSDAESHDYLSETYEPLEGIAPSGTGQSQEVNAQRITITATKDWIIPRQYVDFVPALSMFLTVFKFHRDDPADVVTYWQGFVRSVKFDSLSGKGSVICDPLIVMLKRSALRRTFSGLCGHVLYDGFCPVPASAFKVDGILLSDPTGFSIVAAAWDAQPDGWFKLGFVERVLPSGITDMRFITGHVGDTLNLLSPFPDDLTAGEELHAYAGCDRLFSTCSGKFGAYTDTGGACGCYHRVPKKNLFKTGVNNAG